MQRRVVGRLQQVLAGFQVCAVVVGEDLVALFGAQFAGAACPLADATGHFPQRFAFQHLAQMGQKILPESGPGPFGWLAGPGHAALSDVRDTRAWAAASMAWAICRLTACATGGGNALPTCR